jgi:hypothetical protein
MARCVVAGTSPARGAAKVMAEVWVESYKQCLEKDLRCSERAVCSLSALEGNIGLVGRRLMGYYVGVAGDDVSRRRSVEALRELRGFGRCSRGGRRWRGPTIVAENPVGHMRSSRDFLTILSSEEGVLSVHSGDTGGASRDHRAPSPLCEWQCTRRTPRVRAVHHLHYPSQQPKHLPWRYDRSRVWGSSMPN